MPKKKTDKVKIEKEPLSHGEKLKKNLDDVRFVLILLTILILIVGGWNIFSSVKISESLALSKRYETVRENVRLQADDKFLRKAKTIRERDNERVEMKQFIQNSLHENHSGITFKRNSLGELEYSNLTPNPVTKETYLTTPAITLVTMEALVLNLETIRRNSINIWCTEIDKLEPLLNEDGFAQVFTVSGKKTVGYKIGKLRFSRFSK
jgi:hypothetical protein